MLNLLAISCVIRQQNLDLTSSLYSMGASIPALDYRKGISAYANSTFDTPLLKQTPSSPDYMCVFLRALK